LLVELLSEDLKSSLLALQRMEAVLRVLLLEPAVEVGCVEHGHVRLLVELYERSQLFVQPNAADWLIPTLHSTSTAIQLFYRRELRIRSIRKSP